MNKTTNLNSKNQDERRGNTRFSVDVERTHSEKRAKTNNESALQLDQKLPQVFVKTFHKVSTFQPLHNSTCWQDCQEN